MTVVIFYLKDLHLFIMNNDLQYMNMYTVYACFSVKCS